MIEGPLGAAAYNNEFGRPNLCGYFRTFEQATSQGSFGYHKPIMLAGGMGNIRAAHVEKGSVAPGDLLIVLGGPAMLIGLGGGAASSATESGNTELDFASVQRDNAEMERRAQEVIDRCWQRGEANPIVSLHDVGAGGLSNAFPELVKDGGRGGTFDLRAIPRGEEGLSALETWCNEAQERYVLVIAPEDLRCSPRSVIASAAHTRWWAARSRAAHRADRWRADAHRHAFVRALRQAAEDDTQLHALCAAACALDFGNIPLADAIERVLRFPAVASKSFLITIATAAWAACCAGPDGRPVAGTRRGLRGDVAQLSTAPSFRKPRARRWP